MWDPRRVLGSRGKAWPSQPGVPKGRVPRGGELRGGYGGSWQVGYGLLAKAPFVPGEGTGKEGLVTLEGWWQGLCKPCFLVSKVGQV